MDPAWQVSPPKRRVEPYSQGDLDYLCAIYAIINAVRALCPEITESTSTSLFKRLVRSLGTHSKDVLLPFVSGTDASLCRRLLDEAISYVEKRLGVRLIATGQAKALRSSTIALAWQRLSQVLDDRTVLILPLGGCCNHWTLIYDVKPKKIRLIDSGHRRTLPRARCTLRPTTKRYRLDLQGAISLSRKPRQDQTGPL